MKPIGFVDRFRKQMKDESGVALMMAIFCVTMLMVIATEIMYETNVELAVSSQSVNQVKAHYAAEAGVEISLLRIFIYRKASALVGDSPLKSMLDPIWNVPFTWPPMVPGAMTSVNKDELKETVKKSAMQGEYLATIEAESAKLDINDLASPLKGIADNTKKRIKDIFVAKMESDEVFDRKYRNYDFDTLIGNIKDYVDEDKLTDDGGQESSKYNGMGKDGFYPPNQPFKTIEELHMVAGMTGEFFDILKASVTIYGSKGINVNYADDKTFAALDPKQFTKPVIAKIKEMRDDPNRGPFKDEKDFLGVAQSAGVNDDRWYYDDQKKPKILLLFASEYNFRIRSTGKSGRVQKDIVAIVYDFDRVKARLTDLANKMGPPAPSGAPGAPPLTPEQQKTADEKKAADEKAKKDAGNKVPNERPNIVYWNET